jgi:hypothetical protein
MCVTIEKMDFSWLHTRVNFEFSFELFWRVLIAVWCVNNICLGKWKEFILFSVNIIEQLGQYGRYINKQMFYLLLKALSTMKNFIGSRGFRFTFMGMIWNNSSWDSFCITSLPYIKENDCLCSHGIKYSDGDVCMFFSFCYGCSTVVSWFTFSLYCVKCVVFVWSNLHSDQFFGFFHCMMFVKFFVKT